MSGKAKGAIVWAIVGTLVILNGHFNYGTPLFKNFGWAIGYYGLWYGPALYFIVQHLRKGDGR